MYFPGFSQHAGTEPSWHSTDIKRLNVVEIMSVYGKKKTRIQCQNNVEHQIVEVVLLTHNGFNLWVVQQINIICRPQPQDSTVIQHWHLHWFNSDSTLKCQLGRAVSQWENKVACITYLNNLIFFFVNLKVILYSILEKVIWLHNLRCLYCVTPTQ